MIKRRFNVSPTRIKSLRECMCEETISSDEKLSQLRSGLARMHKDERFEQCRNMGEVTFLNIAVALDLEEEAPSPQSPSTLKEISGLRSSTEGSLETMAVLSCAQ